MDVVVLLKEPNIPLSISAEDLDEELEGQGEDFEGLGEELEGFGEELEGFGEELGGPEQYSAVVLENEVSSYIAVLNLMHGLSLLSL